MSHIPKSSSPTLGQRIQKARMDARLSQKDLAKAIHLSDKTVSAYERNRSVPPVPVLREISQITYKPIAYFVEEHDADDVELTMKLALIERELAELKELIRIRASRRDSE